MKMKWYVTGFLVLVLCAGAQLHAQESKVDPVKKFAEVKAKAENGDAEAQFTIAVYYEQAFGVPTNFVEAVKWYRKAAQQGLADAQCALGSCFEFGTDGVAKDEAEAVKWYRKAADNNLAGAQYNLGTCYSFGNGVAKDYAEATKWYRKAAEQGYADAQRNLGVSYQDGLGVEKDDAEAVKWFRKAAEQGSLPAYVNLGFCYSKGLGVPKDDAEAVKWYRMAAEQGNADGQRNLGVMYGNGEGVPQDYVEAYKWSSLAAAQGATRAKENRDYIARFMTAEQIAEAQRLSAAFVPRKEMPGSNSNLGSPVAASLPIAVGTGFFITDDGYLISNYHVVKDAAKVRLVTSAGTISAKVVQVDAANDLALLKADGRENANAEGRKKNEEPVQPQAPGNPDFSLQPSAFNLSFKPLPIISSRAVKLGGTVATVGFPNPGMQGFSPKLAKGEIAALAGAADDARYFQISVPVQPGNSGGALVDEHGNVVGIVSAKLDAATALASSGALPENVNYAVKSSFLLSFLESVPEVSAKLKPPATADRKFEDVVKSAQDAAVLVLVY